VTGPARSQALVRWTSAGVEFSPAFVCPDGYTTLVKWLVAHNSTQAETLVIMRTASPNSGVTCDALIVTVPPADSTTIETWIALHPGDYVQVYAGAAGVTIWLSGAVLWGAPQFPSAESADPVVYPPQVGSLPA